MSALQVSRECEISYKSALRVMHGVRESMGENGAPALGGPGKTLEADETYCGGKPRYKGAQYGNKHGRGTKKVPVVGIAERGGGIRLRVVDRVTSATLASALREHADPRSRLVTDDLRDYCKPGATFAEHATVNHTRKEYARGDVHSNSIEGAFSLLKRGLYGTFHSVSRGYLPRYLNEFEFRHNYRFTNDGERTVRAIKAAEGKVSPYCERTTA